jgi:hypothetical protein
MNRRLNQAGELETRVHRCARAMELSQCSMVRLFEILDNRGPAIRVIDLHPAPWLAEAD